MRATNLSDQFWASQGSDLSEGHALDKRLAKADREYSAEIESLNMAVQATYSNSHERAVQAEINAQDTLEEYDIDPDRFARATAEIRVNIHMASFDLLTDNAE